MYIIHDYVMQSMRKLIYQLEVNITLRLSVAFADSHADNGTSTKVMALPSSLTDKFNCSKS